MIVDVQSQLNQPLIGVFPYASFIDFDSASGLRSFHLTTVVNAVRGLLKKDPLKSTFLNLICNQMSERTLLSLNTDELHEFWYLYDFFIVKHHQKPYIYIKNPT